MYTVHEIHVFLHVSCVKAYMIHVRYKKTCIKHAWYETCTINEIFAGIFTKACKLVARNFGVFTFHDLQIQSRHTFVVFYL